MKRFFIKIGTMVMTIILSILITGCDNKEHIAKGYGLVHKDYVGIATMTTKRARVRALSFEEVFLPTHWAEITDQSVNESLCITYINSRKKEVKLAKYIVVGNRRFTGKLSED